MYKDIINIISFVLYPFFQFYISSLRALVLRHHHHRHHHYHHPERGKKQMCLYNNVISTYRIE